MIDKDLHLRYSKEDNYDRRETVIIQKKPQKARKIVPSFFAFICIGNVMYTLARCG